MLSMEIIVFQNMVEHLLLHYFRSKKELACKTGVSYRLLLNCCIGKGTRKAMYNVSAGILRYCVENRIALGDAINLLM